MHTPKESNKKITLKTNKFLVVSDADVVESVFFFRVENSFSTNSFYDFSKFYWHIFNISNSKGVNYAP